MEPRTLHRGPMCGLRVFCLTHSPSTAPILLQSPVSGARTGARLGAPFPRSSLRVFYSSETGADSDHTGLGCPSSQLPAPREVPALESALSCSAGGHLYALTHSRRRHLGGRTGQRWARGEAAVVWRQLLLCSPLAAVPKGRQGELRNHIHTSRSPAGLSPWVQPAPGLLWLLAPPGSVSGRRGDYQKPPTESPPFLFCVSPCGMLPLCPGPRTPSPVSSAW